MKLPVQQILDTSTVSRPAPAAAIVQSATNRLRGAAALPVSRVASASILVLLVLLGLVIPTSAQWVTQSFDLVPGWNAIYLNVDASHTTLEASVASDFSNPIQEVWLWQVNPATSQFVTDPQQPVVSGSQWISWDRAADPGAGLQRLPGNSAFLVRVGGAANYRWNVKGRAMAPHYNWTSSGLNFIGFPTKPVSPPTFDTLLAQAPALLGNAQVYYYPGGELGQNNPIQLFATRSKTVRRGEAYWVRSGDTFNRYFGPLELTFQGDSGISFGDSASQARFRIRNLNATPVTASFGVVPSENAPAGQTPVAGLPPLLLRGALNPANLTYGYSLLSAAPQSVALAAGGQPGSEIEVVIGLNRFQMSGNPGDLFASILRVTDSLGFSQLDVPVTAEVASRAGLWVGDASVTAVNQYLKSYQTNADGSLATSSGGAYVAVETNTSVGAVSRAFPLRLIVHNDGTNSYLLQHVFHGQDASSNLVVATQERFLNPATLAGARRISCTHLPWSADNGGWLFDHPLGSAESLSVTVPLAHDDQSSNPFLHTYHPDHSGMDASGRFPLQRGMQSYDVTRIITLRFAPPADDFSSLTAGASALKGTYSEEVTFLGIGSQSRVFNSSGYFSLNRISPISPLTR